MHEGHRQRLLNRYIREGLEGFEDHEALELLLFYAIPRRDTNAVAHRLLNAFGTISNVFEADIASLMQVEGMGKYAAACIKLVFDTSRRYRMDTKKQRRRIKTMEEAGKYAGELFAGMQAEKAYMICLDMRFCVIHTVCIGEGTLDEAPFYPRRVVAEALKHNAAKVILAHNHPGGSPKPSLKDLEATALAADILKKIGIELLDHIVVGPEGFLSLAGQGLIPVDVAEGSAYAAQCEKEE